MITNSIYGVIPKLTISVNDVPINYNSLTSVELTLTENKHDMCKVEMSGVPSRSLTDFIGAGMFAQIDLSSTFTSSFFGTIEASDPISLSSSGIVNETLFQNVVFTGLGTSRYMRGSNSRSWQNRTLEEVARNFASTYGFSLDVPSDPLIFSNLIQSNETDWQFISRYCNIMGYSITVNGTHMHIFDPFKAKGRQISLHKFFTQNTSSATPYPGQIVKFDGDFGRRAYDGRYLDYSITVFQDNGSTFDLVTSDVIDGINNPASYNVGTNDTALNYVEADRMIRSKYKEQWDLDATVTVLGAPGILPGGLINLDGYGGTFDGLWYVHSATHEVRTGLFLTTVKMRRNNIDTLTDTSTATFRPPPSPLFTNGAWSSSTGLVNVY